MARLVRHLAWQAGCGLDLGNRTSSKDVPQVKGESIGRLENLSFSGWQGDLSKGVSRMVARSAKTERRSSSPKFSLSSQVSTESL